MPDDYLASIQTDGTVTVGGSATGTIETRRDVDWFAVELVAGQTYVIDMEGNDTGGGTLGNAMLRGLYDSAGERIAGTRDRGDFQAGYAQLIFTATESGTYYIAARGRGSDTGTYTVRVTSDSEPDGEDFSKFDDRQSADTGTHGRVDANGVRSSGIVNTAEDVDWFAVDLKAGWTYVVYVEGKDSVSVSEEYLNSQLEDPDSYYLDHKIEDPMLRGLYDSDGNYIRGTRDRDSGEGRDPQLTFTAPESGTYYIAVRGQSKKDVGSYAVMVWVRADPDATAAGATDLGDLAALDGTQSHRDKLDGRNDQADYYRFTLSEAKKVKFHLQRQDADADLYLEDENGAVLRSSTLSESSRDGIAETLQPGTYHVRVAAREEGKNSYQLVYRAGKPDPSANVRVTDPVEPSTPPQTGENPNPTPSVSVTDPVGERAEVIRQSVSEPSETDFAGDISTQGRVAVNGYATGDIGKGDRADWFAMTLEAGHTYRIEMKGGFGPDRWGRVGEYGTLLDPYLRGIHDADGNFIEGTANNNIYFPAGDSRTIVNSRVFFTPTESGTYYLAAGNGGKAHARADKLRTYTVVVTDTGTDDFTADTDTTGAVPVDGSITGRIEVLDDVDWFATTLEKGTAYRLDMAGVGWLRLKGEAVLGIHDADGNLIPGTVRDHNGHGGNIQMHFTVPETGTYYIAAGTDSKYVSWEAANSRHLLSLLNKYSNPRAAEYWANIYDPLFVYGSQRGIEAAKLEHRVGTYELSLAKIPDDFTADNTARAGSVTAGDPATGEIGHPGDIDWFAVTLEKGGVYWFEVVSSTPGEWLRGETGGHLLKEVYDADGKAVLVPLRAPTPAYMLHGIHDADGTLVAGTAVAARDEGENSRVVFTAPDSGTYYVAAGADGDHLGAYTLLVREFEKDDYAANTGTTGRIAASDSTGTVPDDGAVADGDGAAAHAAPVGRVPAGGGTATGEIGHPGDHDWFAVIFESGKTYRIDLKGAWSRDGTLADPYLRGVHDSAGEFLDWSGYFSHPGRGRPTDDDGGNGTNARLYFTPYWNGVHYIAVSGDGDTSLGTYTLAVEEFAYGL